MSHRALPIFSFYQQLLIHRFLTNAWPVTWMEWINLCGHSRRQEATVIVREIKYLNTLDKWLIERLLADNAILHIIFKIPK
ncbi:hypothetical protein SEUCBS140593_008793 [Sporothrix eucalyptigena]|uniref:Uncharacterized protein n=1 Tax=Sporothrix eucalyptigena TaxID=1812306 RepID=A0ABP0CPJ8_9PEZI